MKTRRGPPRRVFASAPANYADWKPLFYVLVNPSVTANNKIIR